MISLSAGQNFGRPQADMTEVANAPDRPLAYYTPAHRPAPAPGKALLACTRTSTGLVVGAAGYSLLDKYTHCTPEALQAGFYIAPLGLLLGGMWLVSVLMLLSCGLSLLSHLTSGRRLPRSNWGWFALGTLIHGLVAFSVWWTIHAPPSGGRTPGGW